MRLRIAVAAAVAALCIAGVSVAVAAGSGSQGKPSTTGQTQGRLAKAHGPARPREKLAHGFNGNDQAEGRIVNLTPYSWTFVTKGGNNTNVDRWDASSLPASVKPGQSFVYRLNFYGHYGTTHQYNGFFTYRADAVNHAEYLTVDLEGTHCTPPICFERDGPGLVPKVFNTSRAPTHNNVFIWDFGPATPNPEIGWTSSGSANVFPGQNADFDFTFQTKGNYTLDAAKAPPQLSALINAMCAGASGTSCSFTKQGDIHWGIGDLDRQTAVKSCGPHPPSALPTGPQRNVPAPSPDWHEVTVEARRTRSVSVGGSLTGSAEVKLFGVVDSEVSAKIGIEHEWSNTQTLEKTTRIYVPEDWIAAVWVAPVVGKVSGTLVVKTALASYTITNFEETASGVSKDLTTPAFNIITNSRKMTAAEFHVLCPEQTPRPIGGLG